jgi:hypothetical protein
MPKMAIKIPNGSEIHQNYPSQSLPNYTESSTFGKKPSGNPGLQQAMDDVIFIFAYVM